MNHKVLRLHGVVGDPCYIRGGGANPVAARARFSSSRVLFGRARSCVRVVSLLWFLLFNLLLAFFHEGSAFDFNSCSFRIATRQFLSWRFLELTGGGKTVEWTVEEFPCFLFFRGRTLDWITALLYDRNCCAKFGVELWNCTECSRGSRRIFQWKRIFISFDIEMSGNGNCGNVNLYFELLLRARTFLNSSTYYNCRLVAKNWDVPVLFCFIDDESSITFASTYRSL